MAKAKKKTVNTINNDVSPILMVAIFVIFIIAMVFVAYFGMKMNYPASKYFSQYGAKVENNLGKLISEQKKMDDRIKDLSESGGYTLDSPLVIENPYKLNKLSAIVVFNTNEETKVKVSINDVEKTTVEKSTKHIIPIYGLYEGSKNIVELTLDDGSTKTIDIILESYNDDVSGIDIEELVDNEDIYYLAGNTQKKDSLLRGFDSKGNLIAYYDLNYVNGLSVYKNSLSISYNQNMNIVNDLRLDVDYLGRIISISSDVEDVNKKVNLSDGKEVSYIGASGYLYDNMIENYSVNPITINDNYSPKTELDIKDYDARLSGALKYAGDFEVSYMGDYIAYKSEKEAELIVISINGNIASYKINNNGIIRTNISGQKALYINVDGIVYNLSITLID